MNTATATRQTQQREEEKLKHQITNKNWCCKETKDERNVHQIQHCCSRKEKFGEYFADFGSREQNTLSLFSSGKATKHIISRYRYQNDLYKNDQYRLVNAANEDYTVVAPFSPLLNKKDRTYKNCNEHLRGVIEKQQSHKDAIPFTTNPFESNGRKNTQLTLNYRSNKR